jgi:hypothetical protein
MKLFKASSVFLCAIAPQIASAQIMPGQIYKGHYSCLGKETVVELEVTGNTEAIFKFGGDGSARGSYYVKITPHDNNIIRITPTSWISQPAGYLMIGATVALKNKNLSGYIEYNGCKSINASLVEAENSKDIVNPVLQSQIDQSFIGDSRPVRTRAPRYRWSWDSTAATPAELDQWIGRHPRTIIGGENFFAAIDTINGVLENQDSTEEYKLDPRPLKWGKVIKSSAYYMIPFCRGDECEDPDKGATRLIGYYDIGLYKKRFNFHAYYYSAYANGISICDYPADSSWDREVQSAGCFFVDRKPLIITPLNAMSEFEKMRTEHASAEADYRKRNPYPEHRCFPTIQWPDHSVTGEMVWNC